MRPYCNSLVVGSPQCQLYLCIMYLLRISDLNNWAKGLMPCVDNVLFIQGARGNDGLPGPAGPPVSIIFI